MRRKLSRKATHSESSSAKQTPGAFGPAWLNAQLTTLAPAFPNVALCVALSGGVDSTALLAALAVLAAKRPRSFQLRALHVDHGLRPASKQWAAHCRTLARKLQVPLKILTTKVERSRGTSLEAAARDARYGLLAAALHPGEILLTAHHSDDQLETVLLQLLRGSGLPGISAMPALAPFAHGFLARPLLSRSRGELETWVRAQGLTWVEDDTNVDESLDRNYLRLRILPLIRDRWPAAATAVARSARHAAEAQSLLDTLALADVDRASYGESLWAKSLRALSPARRRNALRFWITRAGFLAPDTRRLEELAGPLLDARPDANPFVTWGEGEGSVCAQRHGDLLSLRPQSSAAAPPADLVWSWHDSLTYDLPRDLGKLELEPDPRGPLDLDSLPPTLTIRWRVGGERLSPRPGGPRRALKSLLQESHVPVPERAHLPLLFSTASSGATSSEEGLLAVADLLLDETVQATPTTRRRARLLWKKSSH
ncbi:MAG TPA: tRNA lysidine(34) synthetase TilS [Steroidobacteraceae bacterium]|nr:tRNA lysidine(34) synthetase TilS [Steroidobacteraceae bacterium]